MFEGLATFFKRVFKVGQESDESSKDTAKERLHLVLMQDRANVSADFLDLMKQEIIDVIKKYIEVDEKEIDVRLTNQSNDDGTNGAPALYANIPILNIRNDMKSEKMKENEKENIDEEVDSKKSTRKENTNKKKIKDAENVEDIKEDKEDKKKKKETEVIEETKVEKEIDDNNDKEQSDNNKNEAESVDNFKEKVLENE